jgi:L-ascorbate metabolism protein UlaG (beta-lactamase superfamily)
MHPFEDYVVSSRAVGIHWFGQNSFALKDASGTIVQVDPYFPRERPPDRFVHARPPLLEAALRTDFVLLTHNHGDHTCLETLGRIRAAYPEVRCVGPVESIAALEKAGFPSSCLTVVAAGQRVSLGSMAVNAVWSKPAGGLPQDGIAPPDVQHLGYVIEAGGTRVYVSGDLVNTFAEHEFLLQPIRQLAPDLGLITLHPTEGEFPTFEGAAKMAVSLGLKAVAPAHYACFTSRTYDPHAWAAHLPAAGPALWVIPYNQAVRYPD